MITLLFIILILAIIVLVLSIVFKIIGFTLHSIFRHPLIMAIVVVVLLAIIYTQ